LKKSFALTLRERLYIIIETVSNTEELEMAFCGNCGAQLRDGDLFCGSCGAPVERTIPEKGPVAGAEPARFAQEPNAVETPAQPVWAQYLDRTQGQPNGSAAPQQTFYVPQKPLGKGGGVTMIVFGSILIFSFICGMIGMLAGDEATVAGIMSLVLTCLAGGALLLAFGIRKIMNVNRYNRSIRNDR
jgi:hypothetical protein